MYTEKYTHTHTHTHTYIYICFWENLCHNSEENMKYDIMPNDIAIYNRLPKQIGRLRMCVCVCVCVCVCAHMHSYITIINI